MKLRYVIEEHAANGATNVRATDFDKAEIIIGRGAGCDIRFESTAVSLTHAKLFEEGRALIVEDLGSLGGTLVNGRLVPRASLRSGDKLNIGEFSFTLKKEDAGWALLERRVEAPAQDAAASAAREAERLDVRKRLPPMRFIASVLVLAVAVPFFLLPITGRAKESWSAGELTPAHHFMSSRCGACHGAPFEPVADNQCLACHAVTDHAPAFKEHPKLLASCATCHLEHKGMMALLPRNSKLCIECHADLRTRLPESTVQRVTNFEHHPEFRVAVQPAIEGSGAPQMVRLNDREHLADNSALRLNHAVHLKEIRGPNGPVQLTCRDCHELASDHRTIVPISFDRNCRSCHSLGFDDRLPGVQAPHGDPDGAFAFMFVQYAKLALVNQGAAAVMPPAAERIIPGSASPGEKARAAAAEDFAKQKVMDASRSAEDVLFSKTGCQLCHIVDKAELSGSAGDMERSRYHIKKPNVPGRWMPDALFSHGAHEIVKCEECHHGVRESKATSDVLLPGIADCQTCHADGHSAHGHAGVKSPCTMCHTFHDAATLANAKKQTIAELVPASKK
jgi:hypothetical protein